MTVATGCEEEWGCWMKTTKRAAERNIRKKMMRVKMAKEMETT